MQENMFFYTISQKYCSSETREDKDFICFHIELFYNSFISSAPEQETLQILKKGEKENNAVDTQDRIR